MKLQMRAAACAHIISLQVIQAFSRTAQTQHPLEKRLINIYTKCGSFFSRKYTPFFAPFLIFWGFPILSFLGEGGDEHVLRVGGGRSARTGQRRTVAVAPREFGNSPTAALLRKLDRFAH